MTAALVQRATRPQGFICRSCATKLGLPSLARRNIHEGTLEKRIKAQWQWRDQAAEIRAGRKQSMLSMLEERGYINSVAGGRNELDNLMISKRIGAYVGIDPTAASLHVGHLLPFMALYWMYLHGFHTVTLLGGATAKVGDPTGRTASRESQHRTERAANMVAMHYQLKKIWMNVEAVGRRFGYEREWAWHRELVNNNTWLNKLSIMEFLSMMGSGMRLGALLSRDTVKNKMEKGDGMSFAEFTYPLLQAWDWWHMYHTKGIQVQIGGSDQFGNIVAGIDAVKYISKNHPDPDVRKEKEDPLDVPMGFTVPLLTTASGDKFGKSAGNAIWLDKEMTSVFDLYGFFVRTADADVERYLKLFTFFPLDRIGEAMKEHAQDPSKRVPQHLLAYECVELVHGELEAKKAQAEHRAVFRRGKVSLSSLAGSAGEMAPRSEGPQSASLNPFAPQVNSTNAPSLNLTLPRSLVIGQPWPRILWSAGLAKTRSEGHRLVNNQGAYVGSRPAKLGGMAEEELKFTPIKDFRPEIPEHFLIGGDMLVLRVGKWNVRICKIVSDEEYEALGLENPAPGWEELLEERRKGRWSDGSRERVKTGPQRERSGDEGRQEEM